MKKTVIVAVVAALVLPLTLSARLSPRHAAIAGIASCTATGSLDSLYVALDHALDSVLTVNETKEVLVHSYAYCGFPRVLQGLRTLVRVLADRKARGIEDPAGREASPLNPRRDRYAAGRAVLAELTGVAPDSASKADYAVLAPEIEVFLKEHLFSDLFERDVLSYYDREIATVAIIASLGEGVEPMLASHSGIAMRLGASREDIGEILEIASSNRSDSGK